MMGLWAFVLHHGYGLLFAVVLIEQAGAPVPAIPILLLMGAMSGMGYYSFLPSLLLAVLAALAADLVWYDLGRRRGDSILGLLCKLSLEPDSCVKQTTSAFDRWGPATLLIAKFVPGLNTVAPPLAGSASLALWRFIVYDGIGALLWAGSALWAGYLLRYEVERASEWLMNIGASITAVVGLPLGAWLAWKLWQRQRAMRMVRISRIQPEDLKILLDAGTPTTIIDLRPPRNVARAKAKLPGALILAGEDVQLHLKDLPAGAHLVFYCS